VDNVTIREQDSQEVMDVCREVPEAHLIAHEAMDVDEQQLPPGPLLVVLWDQRLLRR
jgi:hypothetical protein